MSCTLRSQAAIRTLVAVRLWMTIKWVIATMIAYHWSRRRTLYVKSNRVIAVFKVEIFERGAELLRSLGGVKQVAKSRQVFTNLSSVSDLSSFRSFWMPTDGDLYSSLVAYSFHFSISRYRGSSFFRYWLQAFRVFEDLASNLILQARC